MYKITLALTIYKQSYNEISRWIDYFAKVNSLNIENLQILLLSDNPELPPYISEYAKKNNFEILSNGKNMKKTMMIREYILNGTIKGDYLYLCDPDDYFDIYAFENLCKEIKDQKNLLINVHNLRIYNNKNRLSETEFDHHYIRNEWWSSMHNFNSIYIVEDIKEQPQNLPFGLCDDMYWFSISCSKGRKFNSLSTNSSYIWSEEAGESNAAFIKKGAKFKIYKDLSKFGEMINFAKEMIQIKNVENNYYIIGRWVIKSAQNNLLASNKIGKTFSFKGVFLMRKFFKLISKVYNDDSNRLTKSYKFKVYMKTFFGRKI